MGGTNSELLLLVIGVLVVVGDGSQWLLVEGKALVDLDSFDEAGCFEGVLTKRDSDFTGLLFRIDLGGSWPSSCGECVCGRLVEALVIGECD